MYAQCRRFENVKTNRKWYAFSLLPHSCLDKNNFVMISIWKKNTQLNAAKLNAAHTMSSCGFQARLEWKTENTSRIRIKIAGIAYCASLFSSCRNFNSCARSLQKQKNIYMLNYDLTLLFKQFILMLVAVMVQSYSLVLFFRPMKAAKTTPTQEKDNHLFDDRIKKRKTNLPFTFLPTTKAN